MLQSVTMMSVSRTILFFIHLVNVVIATTEWFGDLRAHLNPDSNPAFYDVSYDDEDCPLGIVGNAVPNYVYFGPMVATMSANSHDQCLQKCTRNSKCRAVNYFEPMSFQEKAFCELLEESQLDNPRLMRPFRKSVYYDNIRCRTDEDLTSETNIFTNVKRLHQLTEKTLAKTSEVEQEKNNALIPEKNTDMPKDKKDDILLFLKKFGPKIHQFNMQFRSKR